MQLSIVPATLLSTTMAMARLASGHQDLYKPGTRRERVYMHRISSVYQVDSIVDATAATEGVIQRDVISRVKVYTQDVEFKLDK